MSQRIVVLSDMQVPYHDKRAVDAVLKFVQEYEPDQLWCVGDELDAPEPSRWSKGMAAEFAPTFWAGITATRDLMASFHEAANRVPFHVMRSNHTERVETYVKRYAPALASLPDLRVEKLLGYTDAGITYHRRPWVAPFGWVLAHGDEGGGSRIPGSTAMALARKTGRSVVCGHTHSMGLQHETRGVNGDLATIYGVEVGYLMDPSKAHYLPTGSANWQQGFAVLHVDGKRVVPQLVPIVGRTFVVDGQRWSW